MIQEQLIEVPQIQYQERIVEVPQVQMQEVVRHVPVVIQQEREVQVMRIETVERILRKLISTVLTFAQFAFYRVS